MLVVFVVFAASSPSGGGIGTSKVVVGLRSMLSARERRPLKADGFVNSTSTIPGSSSSVKLTSSEFEVDLDDLDEDEHDARRSRPEEVTVHFLMSFLQFVLNLCLLQDEGNREVRPRVERLKATIRVAGYDISAEDDGGICMMDRQPDGWRMVKPYLALVEAKRAFKYLDFDEWTGQPKPVVSNETLAQYLGEAVMIWRANRTHLHQDVFLLAATNTFLRVIYFKFGSHYNEYVDATSKEAQTILVDDENKDTFIYMNSTKWFNLQTSGGRKSALCHILAIIRWHDNPYTISLPAIQDCSDRDPEADYNGPEVDHSDEAISSGDDDDLPPIEDHSDQDTNMDGF
ncbi:hypothetical protein DTO012A7_9727 [Penicillium roqueforti]|nr:hypothetical protein DTO012A7_9727 [Penicillium roqueforti]